MSTNQKSSKSLQILIISAVVLFIISIVWKQTHKSNAEKVTVVTKEINEVIKNSPIKETPKVIERNEIASSTNDEREARRLVKEKNRMWSYRFTSEETIKVGIKEYTEKGDLESVAELEELLAMLPKETTEK